MKREFLKSLELSEDMIDKIMAEYGKSVEAEKAKVTTADAALKTAQEQLTEANKQIESFKALKPEELQKAADDYKVKFEQAQKDAQSEIAKLKFDHALDGALTSAKAKNAKAVKALLDTELLKLAEDGSVSGLKEQLEKIQKDNDFLFESETPDPKIVLGGNNQPIKNISAFEAAARKGAGLAQQEGK